MEKIKGTKLKILKKAEKLFAERGYSATPVSKIAEECDITKSLVFYHFNKKKDILKSIIKHHFAELKKHRDKMIKVAVENYNSGEFQNSDKIFVDKMVDIMLQKEKFWKLMFYEIIRDDEVWSFFRDFIRMWHEDLFEKLENKGIEIRDKKKFIFNRMFNVIGPIMLYTIKKDEWNEYFDITEKKARENFIRNFKYIMEGNTKGRDGK
ncbi:MAG: TetR/AcrR family transcriptional regulator [Candidatus Mcinerneyibacterium aminivorans]|uniref:TetR/AcrR family transcriptional regulator n=1 Tax=Candidatus Mcinerneyibacterium aminivorans TaxID=2703815 RepID=A0A5D0MBQ4_9BACT|nr:MAG: TetR/AcrR family transcriptional regulator [Candidatus Mcinerneyibacterium aminivorans]